MKATNREGYTLVEIMVVVVIIGFLAAMTVPGIIKGRATSQDKTITNNLRQLASAAQQYMLETGSGSAPYTALVGNSSYLSNVEQVGNEDYTSLNIGLDDNQVSIVGPNGMVTYTF